MAGGGEQRGNRLPLLFPFTPPGLCRSTVGRLIRLPVLLFGKAATSTEATPAPAASAAAPPDRVAAAVNGARGAHRPPVGPFHTGRGSHTCLGCLVKASSAVQAQQAWVNGTHKGFAVLREARFLLVCTNDSGSDLIIPRCQASMTGGHMVSHFVMILAMDQLENCFPVASLGELCEPEKALQTNPGVPNATGRDA